MTWPRSVDAAAEQEWDLIELVASDAARAALAAPRPDALGDDARPYGRPTARELLEAVRELLADKVVTGNDAALAYEARVAANLLATVERELAHPPVTRDGDDWSSLALSVRDKLIVASPKHLDRASASLSETTA